MKRFALGALLTVLTVLTITNTLALRQLSTSRRPSGPDAATVHTIDTTFAPTRGSGPVTLTVFSDFQCPFCAKAVESINQIEAKYPGRVRIAFKHFPLPIHADAVPAAIAAEAAHNQGRFWDFHDLVFANQSRLDAASLRQHAATLGLDLARYDRDVNDPATAAKVQADAAEAKALKVGGTPTVFINGRYAQSNPISLIDEELAKTARR